MSGTRPTRLRWGCTVKAEDRARGRKRAPAENRVQREIVAWLWVILAFLFINGTLVQARVIPSGSMERTLLIGDHLIMSRFGYDAGIPFTHWHVPLWRNPHRQEIVIFRPPANPDASDLVKRVIGLPGDVVEIHDGSVWINGKKLAEPYLKEPMDPRERSGPYFVPMNSYFVMGDNRNNSYDSRYWGFVPRSSIIGTPVIIYMSIRGPEEAWQGQIRERLFAYANALIHPGLVRWRRLFLTF